MIRSHAMILPKHNVQIEWLLRCIFLCTSAMPFSAFKVSAKACPAANSGTDILHLPAAQVGAGQATHQCHSSLASSGPIPMSFRHPPWGPQILYLASMPSLILPLGMSLSSNIPCGFSSPPRLSRQLRVCKSPAARSLYQAAQAT